MYNIFDFIERRNQGVLNVIKEWTLSLQKKERAKLNQKIDILQQHGPNLSPKLLSDTGNKKIDKIRVNGKVALRLFLCRGPMNPETEFTLLYGAIEKDRKTIPKNALKRAQQNREALILDPTRRVKHERIS